MGKILEVNNLTKVFGKEKFGEVIAVDHISFELNEGECLGIIGESGSGKSTTVNMITRLVDSTEGTIIFNGQDISSAKGRRLRKAYQDMQMVFQNSNDSFDPRKTLGDGIGESLRNSGLSRRNTQEAVSKLLSMCGLTADFANKYPHEVSGGQCQRAAIARALAINPKFLICDEATSALDVTIQKEIIELLKDLRQNYGKKLSILFISHDIALVQEFCDQVIVMYKGSIVERGTPTEIINNPKDEYTKRLIHSVM